MSMSYARQRQRVRTKPEAKTETIMSANDYDGSKSAELANVQVKVEVEKDPQQQTNVNIRELRSRDVIGMSKKLRNASDTEWRHELDNFPISGKFVPGREIHVKITNHKKLWTAIYHNQRTSICSFCEIHLHCSEGYVPIHRIFLEGRSTHLDSFLKLAEDKQSDDENEQEENDALCIFVSNTNLNLLKKMAAFLYTGTIVLDSVECKDDLIGLLQDLLINVPIHEEIIGIVGDNPRRNNRLSMCFRINPEYIEEEQSKDSQSLPSSVEVKEPSASSSQQNELIKEQAVLPNECLRPLEEYNNEPASFAAQLQIFAPTVAETENSFQPEEAPELNLISSNNKHDYCIGAVRNFMGEARNLPLPPPPYLALSQQQLQITSEEQEISSSSERTININENAISSNLLPTSALQPSTNPPYSSRLRRSGRQTNSLRNFSTVGPDTNRMISLRPRSKRHPNNHNLLNTFPNYKCPYCQTDFAGSAQPISDLESHINKVCNTEIDGTYSLSKKFCKLCTLSLFECDVRELVVHAESCIAQRQHKRKGRKRSIAPPDPTEVERTTELHRLFEEFAPAPSERDNEPTTSTSSNSRQTNVLVHLPLHPDYVFKKPVEPRGATGASSNNRKSKRAEVKLEVDEEMATEKFAANLMQMEVLLDNLDSVSIKKIQDRVRVRSQPVDITRPSLPSGVKYAFVPNEEGEYVSNFFNRSTTITTIPRVSAVAVPTTSVQADSMTFKMEPSSPPPLSDYDYFPLHSYFLRSREIKQERIEEIDE